jgi:hypothetical protein
MMLTVIFWHLGLVRGSAGVRGQVLWVLGSWVMVVGSSFGVLRFWCDVGLDLSVGVNRDCHQVSWQDLVCDFYRANGEGSRADQPVPVKVGVFLLDAVGVGFEFVGRLEILVQ